MLPGVSFLNAEHSYDDADIVIFGNTFDHTTCFRPGAREAPNFIRRASYNFEPYMYEHGVDLSQLKINDWGNFDVGVMVDDMIDEARFFLKQAVYDGKFPIVLGGEHSVTIPAVQSFKDISVITIDAHLDSRDSYLGTRNSHACVTRRCADHVGIENVMALGVRSISKEELEMEEVMPYIDSYTIYEKGIEWAVKKALDTVKNENVYLSIDIDGIDPAYAPGTGTPEPFGLTPYDVKKTINMVGKRMVGFDVVEVCPPLDNGNTSGLAARLVTEALAVWQTHHLK